MCDDNCKCRAKGQQPKWAGEWDFEVVPIGTLARLEMLEAEVAQYRSDLREKERHQVGHLKVGHPTVGEQSGNASPPRTLPYHRSEAAHDMEIEKRALSDYLGGYG